LAGPYPAILDDAVVGAEAKQGATPTRKRMLKKMVEGRWVSCAMA
jgi:5-methyltetrahydrofolate--homocysteine methyltransferase